MIPKIIPPCSGLTVLVTRPAHQNAALCTRVAQAGGTALAFPTIEIQPITAPAADAFDLVVFVSINAVAHGAHFVSADSRARAAAIGSATAAALTQAGVRVDLMPAGEATSESLLNHPQLQNAHGTRVLIVRGEGGRDLLQRTFAERGMIVQTREVYRRVRPQPDPAERERIESHWEDPGIDVVTLTSVETLQHLEEMLSERGRNLLRQTALLVASRRIAEAAIAGDLRGEVIVASGADEASMMKALARWCTRAR